MNAGPERRGSFWASLTGMITAFATFIAATGGVLTILAAKNLWPFPPSAQEPVGLVAPSPSKQDFGRVQRGQASPTRSVSVTNRRKASVAIGVALKGDHPDSFEVALDTCSVAPLSPGAICNLELIFSPDEEGQLAARVELQLPDGSVQRVGLTGFGLPPGALSFSPTSIYLAIDPTSSGQGVGGALASTFATRPVTVTNTGAGQATIINVESSDSHFTVSTGCHGKALAPGKPCTFVVTFAASRNNTYRAKLLVHDNAPGSPHEVSVTGYRGPQLNIFRLITPRPVFTATPP